MKENWKIRYECAADTIDEEIAIVKKVVDDEDSCCRVRQLRRARLEGLRFAQATLELFEEFNE